MNFIDSRQDTGRSPAEMMFNRRTRSFMPIVSNGSKDTVVAEKSETRKCSVKRSDNRKARQLSELDVGQYVFFIAHNAIVFCDMYLQRPTSERTA